MQSPILLQATLAFVGPLAQFREFSGWYLTPLQPLYPPSISAKYPTTNVIVLSVALTQFIFILLIDHGKSLLNAIYQVKLFAFHHFSCRLVCVQVIFWQFCDTAISVSANCWKVGVIPWGLYSELYPEVRLLQPICWEIYWKGSPVTTPLIIALFQTWIIFQISMKPGLFKTWIVSSQMNQVLFVQPGFEWH